MIKTVIKSINLEDQRYETLGDYYIKDGIRTFAITKTGNDLYDDLIFIHEFVEEVLTRNKGITEEQILAFDLQFEEKIKNGEVGEDEEPGEQIDSPYRQEHVIAELIERLIINHLNIDFNTYNNNLLKLFKDANN
jgi:hypothetical protein